MDNESISGDPQNSTSSNGGVSRRSLMKAGAHAAWAIPMVQVVAAAPAIAASGTPTPTAELTYSQPVSLSYGNPNKDMNVSGTVKNVGTRTTQGLVITGACPESCGTWVTIHREL